MSVKLRDAAELTYRLRDIPKTGLVDLMNLFIGLEFSIQKRKPLDRIGYW